MLKINEYQFETDIETSLLQAETYLKAMRLKDLNREITNQGVVRG